MERAFKITDQSKMYKDIEFLSKNLKERYEFCTEFLKLNNIEATEFHMYGDGRVNTSFMEGDKKDIKLSIIPTLEDEMNFTKQLNKARTSEGYRYFKKGSDILKKFQDECILKGIVINLYDLDMRDYFESMGLMGYSRTLIRSENCYYLKLTSNYLKKDDTPNGLEEIKLSEFYKIKEETR